ncbi:hypothetical protein TNIN_449151 [Trichonephila inaurata madagascariensis]|uniref:Uncharacterized protein n=1 Tax=Trichonephila inaurata madagascariensis TaxID=2747483 RepID=A0A8X6XSS7_9ARAC|nr:hypothetical protein TNIN_449151 [Trichonephila inaurata madagascariensis]
MGSEKKDTSRYTKLTVGSSSFHPASSPLDVCLSILTFSFSNRSFQHCLLFPSHPAERTAFLSFPSRAMEANAFPEEPRSVLAPTSVIWASFFKANTHHD